VAGAFSDREAVFADDAVACCSFPGPVEAPPAAACALNSRARTEAGATTEKRFPDVAVPPAVIGAGRVFAASIEPRGIRVWADASIRWTEGPRLTIAPLLTPKEVTRWVCCISVVLRATGNLAEDTLTPANWLTGTNTYAECDTTTAGPEYPENETCRDGGIGAHPTYESL
jgi:hypothetical protein